MYEIKKMEGYLRVNLFGPGPRRIKRIYRALWDAYVCLATGEKLMD